MVPSEMAAQEVSIIIVVVPEVQASIAVSDGLATRVQALMVHPPVPETVNASVAVIVSKAPLVTVLDTVFQVRSSEHGY